MSRRTAAMARWTLFRFALRARLYALTDIPIWPSLANPSGAANDAAVKGTLLPRTR
jgi:hypothetical protein